MLLDVADAADPLAPLALALVSAGIVDVSTCEPGEGEREGLDAPVALHGALEAERDLELEGHDLAAGRALGRTVGLAHLVDARLADDVVAAARGDGRVGGAEAHRAVQVVGQDDGEAVEVATHGDLQRVNESCVSSWLRLDEVEALLRWAVAQLMRDEGRERGDSRYWDGRTGAERMLEMP